MTLSNPFISKHTRYLICEILVSSNLPSFCLIKQMRKRLQLNNQIPKGVLSKWFAVGWLSTPDFLVRLLESLVRRLLLLTRVTPLTPQQTFILSSRLVTHARGHQASHFFN